MLSVCLFFLFLGGEINLDRSFYYTDSIRPVDFSYQELFLKVESGSEELDVKASFKIRLWDREFPLSLYELSSFSAITSYEIIPWEAYATLYGFIFEPLEIRIGKQRIAWGTADRLNHTDNWNPLDLSNPFNFGERIPTDALYLSYQLKESFYLSLGYEFSFKPAVFPKAEFSWEGKKNLPKNIKYQSEEILPPENKPLKQPFGAKFEGKVKEVDFSLSYFRGYDCLFIADSIDIYPVDTLGNLGMFTRYIFPSFNVIGFDFAGEIFSAGFWGEFAYFIPEEVSLVQVMYNPYDSLTPLVSDSVILKEPYLKFTLGTDYTFKNGVYLNFQWMHGFFTERGNDIKDYAILSIEKKFLEERGKLGINTGGCLSDITEIKENLSYAFMPQIVYYPSDNIEISAGVTVLEGKGEGLFALMKDMDFFYLRTKISF